jgi:DNA polymerase (family 10)
MFDNKLEDLSNRDLAAVLFTVATLLRDRGENHYRVRAYLNGARALMRRNYAPIAASLREAPESFPRPRGVLGSRLQKRIRELITTGNLPLLDELCEDLPEHIGALIQVPGVGPRLAQRLHETLGIQTPDQLLTAAAEGRLVQVMGIGRKRQQQFAELAANRNANTQSLAA